MYLLTFFTFVILITSCKGHHCDGPPGKYCSSVELVGYWYCETPSFAKHHRCPANTRCSCFLNNRCADGKPVCKPYHTPLPLTDSFVLQYHGSVTVHHPNGRNKNAIKGVIHQDTKGKRLHKEEYDSRGGRSFVVILPNNNKFRKYEGSYPNHCKGKIITKFEGFMSELSHFTRTKSKPLTGAITRETWYFRNGRRHLGQSLTTTTWEVNADWNTRTMSPVKFSENFYGSANARYSKFTKWNSIVLQNEYPADDWYRIPSHCYGITIN